MLEDNPEIAAVAGQRDTITLPPDDKYDTDEDSDVEEDPVAGMSIAHLGAGMLNAQAELQIDDPEDILPDCQVLDADGDIIAAVDDETREEVEQDDREEDQPTRKPQKTVNMDVEKLSRLGNKDRIWSRTEAADYGSKIPPFVSDPAPTPVPAESVTPYHFFRLFISDSLINDLVIKSRLYCTRKGGEKEHLITADNLLTSMAIMFMTGYTVPARRRMYWETREDTSNDMVKKSMARNLFEDVIRFTYFVDPAEEKDDTDAFWKVRPLFNHMNEMAKQFIAQPEYVSIDESMVRYFGPHPLKQTIREKPDR